MYNAVIVLANLMDAGGRPNDVSVARLSLACEFIRNGLAPVLVTCGWNYRIDTDIRIADALADYAMRHFGLGKHQVITEPNSRDTVGEAIFTKRNLFNRYGWRSLLVVTSEYHVARASEIFSFVYGGALDFAGAEGPDSPALVASEAKSLKAFRATFKGIRAGEDAAIYQRLIVAHPFYNGDVYSSIS